LAAAGTIETLTKPLPIGIFASLNARERLQKAIWRRISRLKPWALYEKATIRRNKSKIFQIVSDRCVQTKIFQHLAFWLLFE
jgi:hypothetical protein